MQPIIEVCGPYAAGSATAIRTASPVAAAGAVTLNGATVSGGVATLDSQRRVTITSTADETGIFFLITGTTDAGDVISETLQGGNAATVYTTLDYRTVTSVIASGASVGNISMGTNGVAGSSWVRLDSWALPSVTVQCNVTGTINYTLQQTYDDPNSVTNPVLPINVTWINVGAAGSTSTINTIAATPTFVRVLVNSFSGAGTVAATIVQAGSVTY